MINSDSIRNMLRPTSYFTVGLLVSTALAGSVTHRTVVLNGDVAPGAGAGVTFGDFTSSSVLLDGAGEVVFKGRLIGASVTTSNDRGVWSETGGTLHLLAREDDPAPGTGTGVRFHGFLDPRRNSSGNTAFHAFLRGTGVTSANGTGIWSDASGGLDLVARHGSPAPGGGTDVNFSNFGSVFFGDSADTVFFTLLSGAGVTSTDYRGIWSEGSGSLAPAARMGDPSPGTSAGVVFDHFSNPVINAAGQSAFRGTLSGPSVDFSNDLGFWSESTGTLGLVAREGDQAPGAGAGVVFSSFANNSSNNVPAINNAGQLTIIGDVSGPGVSTSNDRGLWTGSPGALELLAREGQAAPGTAAGVVFTELLVFEVVGRPGDPFTLPAFTGQVLSGGGQTAFVGGLSGPGVDTTNDIGIWAGDANGLELLLRTGDPAAGTPPGVVFEFFGYAAHDALVLNAANQLAFFGVLVGPGVDATNNTGIWAQDEAGILTLVVRSGDVIEVAPGDTRTVTGLSFIAGSGGQDGRSSGFNDSGQVAFGAQFDDGSSGLFVATVCGGDVNADGQVDLTDLAIMLSEFGCSGAGCVGDLDGDGGTNLTDLAILLSRFGAVCP